MKVMYGGGDRGREESSKGAKVKGSEWGDRGRKGQIESNGGKGKLRIKK